MMPLSASDDTAEFLNPTFPEATMPDPAPTIPTIPTDPWVLRINALSSAIKENLTTLLMIVSAIGSLFAGFHSQQASNQSAKNSQEIKDVTAKVDESARLMTGLPPMVGRAKQ